MVVVFVQHFTEGGIDGDSIDAIRYVVPVWLG